MEPIRRHALCEKPSSADFPLFKTQSFLSGTIHASDLMNRPLPSSVRENAEAIFPSATFNRKPGTFVRQYCIIIDCFFDQAVPGQCVPLASNTMPVHTFMFELYDRGNQRMGCFPRRQDGNRTYCPLPSLRRVGRGCCSEKKIDCCASQALPEATSLAKCSKDRS